MSGQENTPKESTEQVRNKQSKADERVIDSKKQRTSNDNTESPSPPRPAAPPPSPPPSSPPSSPRAAAPSPPPSSSPRAAAAAANSEQKTGGAKNKTEQKSRMGNFQPRRRGWLDWSKQDTEDYRAGYPGKKDHPNLGANLKFYLNKASSYPHGDFIDNIHSKWHGDYKKLESHHGYIQWLFPIRESGMNVQAQELQLHEAKEIMKDERAHARVLKSYEMMLDFYGMKLENKTNGAVRRASNWEPRFKHLNRSFHNYLRITRILKSLGELGYEDFKYPFCVFVLREAFEHKTLDNCAESCARYWIHTVKDDDKREKLINFVEEKFND